MSRNTIVQLIALGVLVIALAASGAMLPGIIERSDDRVLRYTNVSVEGAPPIVVVGTAIGALRGLIVDFLWIKANAMKEKGLFYEAMAQADLITKLQPRFAQVWGFHGHNMAYNISVATHTPEERWDWVNAGIRLVRNEGLRYNPNDMTLHRELAFWFAHKIEGVADDAHLYYKREFCKEWHLLLGQPPEDYAERIAWIKQVADAPDTLEAAEQRTPGVLALIERLRDAYPAQETNTRFSLGKDFLNFYTIWQTVTQQSAAAKILGVDKQAADWPYFTAFSELASDASQQEQWATLIAHVRKRILLDEYNMDPRLMYEYTRDLGPIDWRHGQAHALYWSRRGSQFGSGRLSEEDIYISLNNDSQQLQAMQDLARWGRISFDWYSTDWPGRFPDPRWIDTIDRLFEHYYAKHFDVRGAGGERFINFLQNFLSSAVCEWYRAGETERAQALLDRLNRLFGGTGPTRSTRFIVPLDVFVHEQTFDQYQAQPHLAPRDVSASLQYGYKMGILHGRPEVLRDSLLFAQKVTNLFKEIHWNDYENKWGIGRMKELIGAVEDSAELAYLQMITDPGIPLHDRITIWNNTDRAEGEVLREIPQVLGNRTAPALRALVYDRVMPMLQQQLARSELSTQMTLAQAFPEPPGLEQQRQFLLARQQQREQELAAARERDPFTRK